MGKSMYLAPMAELSHRALRELIEGFGGCDEYFTEMISAGGLLGGGQFEKYYIDPDPVPQKTVFQLVGGDSGQIWRAAGVLDGLECKGIDINMGCSAPLIRKTGAGSAWMSDIDKAGELVAGVSKVLNDKKIGVKKRLSVKLRIGEKEDFDYLVRFCKRLENEGVELITLHPRLISEKFKRRARWDYVKMLKNELKIPVAGNGDIMSKDDIKKKIDEDCCDAVMAGRAAVQMPWIFAEAKGEELSHRVPEGSRYNRRKGAEFIKDVGLRFLELLAKHQPQEFHISRARRFFGFYCDNLKWGNYVKNQINREETLIGIEKVWKKNFLSTNYTN